MSVYYNRQGAPISVEQYSRLHGDEDYHRIGKQHFEGGIRVSTVWLGIDHGFGSGTPILFETMVFSGNDRYPYDQAQMRYCTEQEAIDGHRRTCDDIEHGRRPWFLGEE